MIFSVSIKNTFLFLSRTWYESQIPSSPPDQSLEIREGSNEEEDQISPRQEEQEQLILEDIEDDAARDLEVPVVEEEENDIYDERLEEEVAALAANSANNKEITLAVELEYLQNRGLAADSDANIGVSAAHALLGEIEEVHEGPESDNVVIRAWMHQEEQTNQEKQSPEEMMQQKSPEQLPQDIEELRKSQEEMRIGSDDLRQQDSHHTGQQRVEEGEDDVQQPPTEERAEPEGEEADPNSSLKTTDALAGSERGGAGSGHPTSTTSTPHTAQNEDV